MIEKAVILSTGDELTTGRVVDTNSTRIAAQLQALGVPVAAVLKVGDERERLLWALEQARLLADLVIGTGGLGPTADDLSTEVVALFAGRRLVQNEPIANALQERFAARGIPWTANNLKQALFPEGATIIPNPVGTAPGFRLSIGSGKQLIWLSGVPREMTAMMEAAVLPWVSSERGAEQQISACTFKLYGVTESKLDDVVKPIELGPTAKLSFRAHYPDLSLRLAVTGGAGREALFTRLKREIAGRLGDYVYADQDLTLEEVVGRLLLERGHMLAVAESCTGGYISHRITRVAGSSAYFHGGAVTYSNQAKSRILGIREETLQNYGAVSRETALEMSRTAKEKTGSSIALGVTGIAGPGGGSAAKPVGTVWMSVAHDQVHEARLFTFHGDRKRIIAGASQAALHWVRRVLLRV
jgi:nicotinamide-nucleotide amidase